MPTAPFLAGCNLDADLSRLINDAPLPPVGSERIDAMTQQSLEAWLRVNNSLNESCQAGLWLLAGDLERSHALSQALPTHDGSFWHGIMHRREGDFENAKYWFRRVGNHPVLTRLAEEIAKMEIHADAALPWTDLQNSQRVAAGLVDCCRGTQSELIQRIAWIEWQLLFLHCLPTQG